MDVRSLEQRRKDALALLQCEVDLWVASASETGEAYLVPLSFYWNGTALVMATPVASRTARNLRRAGWARVAIGEARDVVIVEGSIEMMPPDSDPDLADAHAAAAGFDAREGGSEFVFILLTPERMQAWRNPAELPGRHILGDGSWLV